MKRSSFRLIALTVAVLGTAAACTLIAEVDRSKIATEDPDPTNMGGDSGTGGGNGTGGSSQGGGGGLGGSD
jgi:hypothetical protein